MENIMTPLDSRCVLDILGWEHKQVLNIILLFTFISIYIYTCIIRVIGDHLPTFDPNFYLDIQVARHARPDLWINHSALEPWKSATMCFDKNGGEPFRWW